MDKALMDDKKARKFLQLVFDKTWTAATAQNCIKPYLPDPPAGKTIVVGAGKASADMAAALESHWSGPLKGLVLTRYGHTAPTNWIEVVEASHPVPDEAGQRAAQRIVETVSGLSKDDLVICLISGGGSALLSAPAPCLTFAQKQDINRQLLTGGVPIDEMNCLRKHLSAIKGGRLAQAAFPAKVVSLLISDVPGDDPAVIASGPTVADSSTSRQALTVIEKYNLTVPDAVRAYLQTPQSETPKPGDEKLQRAEHHIIAAPSLSLQRAEQVATEHGFAVTNLRDDIEGEARDVARDHARLALAAAPGLIISGGETTVTLKGTGRGGRNAEYALALALALDGKSGIYAIACDTDGIDGSEDNAGATITPTTLQRGRALGLEAKDYLENNDAYSFFDRLGDLIITGPTRTNVNDFRAILITGS